MVRFYDALGCFALLFRSTSMLLVCFCRFVSFRFIRCARLVDARRTLNRPPYKHLFGEGNGEGVGDMVGRDGVGYVRRSKDRTLHTSRAIEKDIFGSNTEIQKASSPLNRI